ncbi:Hypothetical predicted protein [Olea europaea subsp. europaea]|uniref:Uncharacterized protein n=1 Tax=Olea europaea subsp. europaea TaxID=158383 RepID=A0A8S0SD68_OLEEU|nr:Hypothetical predicted protein [Olea europaea subsp. europaea]
MGEMVQIEKEQMTSPTLQMHFTTQTLSITGNPAADGSPFSTKNKLLTLATQYKSERYVKNDTNERHCACGPCNARSPDANSEVLSSSKSMRSAGGCLW